MSLTLTSDERLLISRRRRGETQFQAAAGYNVTPKMYGAWERGQREVPFPSEIMVRLGSHERCLILRRRSGKTQAEIAVVIGCSRWWVNRMERGLSSPRELMNYWSD